HRISAPGGTGLDTTQHDYRKTSIERFMNVGVSVKILALVLTIVLLAGCSKESKDSSGKDADAERGRAAYLANCVACHNNDPSKETAPSLCHRVTSDPMHSIAPTQTDTAAKKVPGSRTDGPWESSD